MQAKEKINSEKCYSKKLELLRPALLSYAKKRIFSKEDAEDIVQNTLLILIDKKDSFDPEKSFLSWGLNICQFQIKSYLTKRKRSIINYVNEHYVWQKKRLEKYKYKIIYPKYSWKTPFDDLIEKEKIKIFPKIKPLLNDKEQDVLKLGLAGFTPKEIKNKLNINDSNYSVTRHRALAKAKKFFSNKSIKEHQP